MLLTKEPTPEELAAELRRRDDEPPLEKLGLIARWRRNRMSRKLGRADLTAVFRAYYGDQSARQG